MKLSIYLTKPLRLPLPFAMLHRQLKEKRQSWNYYWATLIHISALYLFPTQKTCFASEWAKATALNLHIGTFPNKERKYYKSNKQRELHEIFSYKLENIKQSIHDLMKGEDLTFSSTYYESKFSSTKFTCIPKSCCSPEPNQHKPSICSPALPSALRVHSQLGCLVGPVQGRHKNKIV